MGTVGPGSLHLLTGFMTRRKSHAPVLAICGQVPLPELGSDFFQEVDNDVIFSDVAGFCKTVTTRRRCPVCLNRRCSRRSRRPGYRCSRSRRCRIARRAGDQAAIQPGREPRIPGPEQIARAVELINASSKVTILAGTGAKHARDELLTLAVG